jgi:hypothetical protein
MSKFGGRDFILAIQDSKKVGSVGVDKPPVSYESKQIITDSALNYAKSKNIPMERCFSTRKNETQLGSYFKNYSINWNQGKFKALSIASLVTLNTTDKLFIFAHGNNFGVAYMADDTPINAMGDNAMALAKMLRQHGLTQVGLITFKACYVGRDRFLENFSSALALNGIRAGWIKGYKGLAATVQKQGGGFTEEITNKNGAILVDNQRFKIVRGPGQVFEGQSFGRYVGQTSQADLRNFALLEEGAG